VALQLDALRGAQRVELLCEARADANALALVQIGQEVRLSSFKALGLSSTQWNTLLA